MPRKKQTEPKDPSAQRTFTFRFTRPIAVTIHKEHQTSDDGRAYRFELETPDGPALMTYDEFIRFAQTVAVLLDPRTLLE